MMFWIRTIKEIIEKVSFIKIKTYSVKDNIKRTIS